jgi:cell division protein FtsZ
MEYQRKAGELSVSHASGHRILVVGIGGAGSNILRRIVLDGGDASLLLCLDTDLATLSGSIAGHKIQLGRNLTRGLTTGADPELGRDAALEAEPELRERFRGVDLVFLVGGLGGGAASGASPVVARLAREEGCFVLAFLTLPFHFEGRRRLDQAREALALVRPHTGALLTFENDRLGQLVVPAEGVQKVFAMADMTICHSIRAITTMLEKPGMIQVGKERLLAVLKGQDARCLFGFGKAAGPRRAEEAVRMALENPLVKDGELLRGASTVLVHISGNSRVTLAEVEQVMAAITGGLQDETEVYFGVSSSEDLGEEIWVALIGSVPQGLTAPVSVSASVPFPVPESPSPAKPHPAPARPAPVHPAPVPGPARPVLTPLPPPTVAPLVPPAAEIPPLVPSGPAKPKVSPPVPMPPAPVPPTAKPAVARPRLIGQEHLAGPDAPEARGPAPATPFGSAVPGVKVDYAGRGAEDGKPSSPTITLVQPEPSFNRPGASAAPYPSAPPIPGPGTAAAGAPALALRHRGRFEAVEPTVIDGEDLDVPTYVRKRGAGS